MFSFQEMKLVVRHEVQVDTCLQLGDYCDSLNPLLKVRQGICDMVVIHETFIHNAASILRESTHKRPGHSMAPPCLLTLLLALDSLRMGRNPSEFGEVNTKFDG